MRVWKLPALLAALAPLGSAHAADAAAVRGLTAVAGIKVGHHALGERPTGCTVVLAEAGAIAGVDVRGGAPATRETGLLDPVNGVQKVHAISLSGGSAFGLDAAAGVMRYLEEKGLGHDARAQVPIVPAASLIDLHVGGRPRVRPDAGCGYAAASSANDGPVEEGNVGAGAGATVGKTAGYARSMKAGLGSAAIALPGGLVVAALVAVNARGDVIDPATGKVVAGVRTQDGTALADARRLLRGGAAAAAPFDDPAGNSTIGVVATNAALTKVQAARVAQMAHDGLARAISPVHTAGDGDTIFALATGARAGEVGDLELSRIGALAAEAMADAVVRAARQASGIPGLPAARDFSGK